MKERPILFSGEMVRAILDGRKTQTRRVVKPQPVPPPARAVCWHEDEWAWESNSGKVGIFNPSRFRCPFGQVGGKLWVRETFSPQSHLNAKAYYKATDGLVGVSKWKPSIFMPRCLSRITLEVTSIRVERLQDISEEDAKAEGCEPARNHDWTGWPKTYGIGFSRLWDSINGKTHPWGSNPWVWVIEFRQV